MIPLRVSLLLTVLASSSVFAQTTIGPDVTETLVRDGAVRVLVALGDDQSEGRRGTVALSQLRASVAAVQNRVLSDVTDGEVDLALRFEAVPAFVVWVRTEAALDALAAHPDVRRIDLDAGGGSGGGLGQSVPLVHASAWHDRGVTGEGVVVAVLDTGIDRDHPDFAGSVTAESCFIDFDGRINGSGRCPNGSDRQTGSGSAEDDHGHGTNVTGIVASLGTVSDVGVAPGVDIVSVKVLDSDNSFFTFSEIVAALDYLITNPDLGVDVVNMSLGSRALFSGVCDNSASWTVAGASAARTLRQRGVALFASSMNDASATSVAAPACLSNVTAVAATTLQDEMATLSNTGPQVAFVAPGVQITASGLGGGLSTYSGTSQASPHAAGCAALLIAAGVATTPDEIESAFSTASTVMVTDPDNGRATPRLDCYDDSFIVATEAGATTESKVLSAPAPNPAHSTARFDLHLPASGSVRAILLDGLGRNVAGVYDGPVAGGTVHPLTVDVRRLPAGVYTLRVSGPSVEASQRLVVVR